MKILLIGISVRSMAESAVHSGYEVVALDAFGDRDFKELAESYSLRRDFRMEYSPGALYIAGRKLVFDSVAYTSNLENHPEILTRFSDGHNILGNRPQTVASVRNWVDLFENLGRAGFPAPETIFPGEVRSVDSGRDWLLRPILSGGGHGIHLCNPEAKNPFGKRGVFSVPGYMLQEFIPGRSCSAAFVANGKSCTVLGICEQLIGMKSFGSRGFHYCGNLLPIPEALDENSGKGILVEVRRLAEFLTREYELAGVNGIDFILNDGQVYLTEVNPRYSASMEIIEIAYGLPMFHLHLQSILSGTLPEFDLEAEMKREMSYGKAYIYAEKDVAMPDTAGWFERGIRDVPESGEKIVKDGPVCTVLAHRQTRRETLAAMIHRAVDLRKEMYA